MHRIFDPELDRSVAHALLYHAVGDEAHHALRVKRIAVGEDIEVFNGAGLVARGQVVEAVRKRNQFTVEVSEFRDVPPIHPILEIAAAVPKGPRAESMIDQLSQVGVTSVRPIQFERSVTKPRDAKISKWERIAIESAKQCGRAHLMRIEPTLPIREYLASVDEVTQCVVAHQDGLNSAQTLDGVDREKVIVIVIGPEGGMTDDEINCTRNSGAKLISIGPYVMRVETAAVCAASICMAHFR